VHPSSYPSEHPPPPYPSAHRAHRAHPPSYPGAALANPPSYPAAFNARWQGFGGSLANQTLAGSIGSVAAPLAGPLAFQFDSLAGSYGGELVGAAAGHLFWRSPSVGLFGVYGANTILNQFGGVSATQVALESERYWNNWSFGGLAGVEFGNNKSDIIATTAGTSFDAYNVKTRFFDYADVSYYLTDNLKVSAGHRYLGGQNAAAFGGEYAFPVGHGMTGAFFAEGRVGENNMHGVWGGLTFYFGPQGKTLIEHERQETIVNRLPDSLFTITNSERKRFAGPPPPTYPPTPFVPTSYPPPPSSSAAAILATTATAVDAAATAAIAAPPYPAPPAPR